MMTSTTSQPRQEAEWLNMWTKRLVVAVVALFVFFLFFYNLTDYPKTWFDEGSHLHVPKALVTMGVYADYSSEGLRHFGPTIGVGPTVMLPIAAAFQLFGIGLLQARLVMALYLAAATLLMFLLARWLLGLRSALVATALLLTMPAIGTVEYGRQVLGEVPGLAFMAAGFLLWFTRWQRSRLWELTLVGALLGLSVVTKYQYLLVLGATLLAAWGLNLFYFKLPQRLFLIPGVVAALIFGAWQLFTLVYLGPATIGENLAMLREVTAGAAAVFSPPLMMRALGELFSAKSFLWTLFPALLYASYALLRAPGKANLSQERRQQLAILYLLTLINLSWYVVASVSWLRYAFVGLAFSAFFVAWMFRDLTLNFSPMHLWRAAQRGQRVVGYGGLTALFWLAAMISASAARLTWTIASAPPDDSMQMAAVMNRTVPLDALVETWEPQMGFLTDHRYHYPPQLLLNRAVRQVWLNETPVAELYDFTELAPDFVLIGEFSRWVNVYPPERLQQAGYERVETLGQFELYRRRSP
ncbi:MAG: glycosyltransferase family 39 protein [Caldilinea sp.]|nr:glycosyltransferase family 39 protein [Caldilinea sp.]MDW8442747.1 glycosyltransferase family 39 protein [Caldilineaceae bacterium]